MCTSLGFDTKGMDDPKIQGDMAGVCGDVRVVGITEFSVFRSIMKRPPGQIGAHLIIPLE